MNKEYDFTNAINNPYIKKDIKLNLTYRKATNNDIESIYNFNKQLIDEYENIEEIDYEKVLQWVRKKIETNRYY